MKAVSLTQPYAALVAIGAKKIETRSWTTLYRGWLAIHAAKGLASVGGHSGLIDKCLNEPFRAALAQAGAGFLVPGQDLPLGALIAVGHLHRIGRIGTNRDGHITIVGHDLPLDPESPEAAFGDYADGRYAWVFTNVRPLPEPIPCRGALGLWDVPTEIAARLEGWCA